MKKEYEKPTIDLVEFEVGNAIAACSSQHFSDDGRCLPDMPDENGNYTDVTSCKTEVYCYHTAENLTWNS